MKRLFENKALRFALQILPVVSILIVIAAFWLSGRELTVESVLSYTPDNTFLAVAFLLFLFVAKSMSVFMPIIILFVAAGSIFPPIPALALNTVGTALCMTVAYWVGYASGSGHVEKLLNRFPKAKQFIARQRGHEWFVSFFLRTVNFLPLDGISMYLGSLKMPFGAYLVSGMLGSLPGIILCTLIGSSISDPQSPMFLLSVLITAAHSLCSLFLYRRIQKKKKRTD